MAWQVLFIIQSKVWKASETNEENVSTHTYAKFARFDKIGSL